MSDLKTQSDAELSQRQKLLEDEIESSEQELHAHQAELNQVYAEQDRRRDAAAS